MVNVTPRSLYLRERDPVHIVQEAGRAPGQVWTNAENLAPIGIRFPDRPAGSESLYRLSYADSQLGTFSAKEKLKVLGFKCHAVKTYGGVEVCGHPL